MAYAFNINITSIELQGASVVDLLKCHTRLLPALSLGHDANSTFAIPDDKWTQNNSYPCRHDSHCLAIYIVESNPEQF